MPPSSPKIHGTKDTPATLFAQFEQDVKTATKAQQLQELQARSWAISKAAMEGVENLQPLRGRIRDLNAWMRNNEVSLRSRLNCDGEEIDNLIIKVPPALLQRVGSVVARVFGTLFALVPSLFMVVYLLLNAPLKDRNSDPKKITNIRTPVVLVHGSGSNQRQWDLFRHFIGGGKVGHVFTLNLNENAFQNDKKNFEQYARERLARKLQNMKKKYAAAGYKLDNVMLVGHSMGGLVSGAYATTSQDAIGIRVSALVSLNSPWYGSPTADRFYRLDQVPQGGFRQDCAGTAALRKAVIRHAAKHKKEMGLYTVNGRLDIAVPVSSSSLPIEPDHQLYVRHNHLTTMIDPLLARQIRNRWLSRYAQELASTH